MDDPYRVTISDAEVLAVCGGVDDATGQPVVVLTLRPITGSGWRSVNYSLHPDNARSLLDRLTGVATEMGWAPLTPPAAPPRTTPSDRRG
jgi:hypothetical protein